VSAVYFPILANNSAYRGRFTEWLYRTPIKRQMLKDRCEKTAVKRQMLKGTTVSDNWDSSFMTCTETFAEFFAETFTDFY